MKDNLDKRYITDEFLLTYFPSPNRFRECFPLPSNSVPNPIPESTLAVSEERYLKFRTCLNQERAKSGKHPLSDYDLAEIIQHEEGYLRTTKELKPNQHL